jgi:phosphonoacetaldehyde hydrolase
MMYRSALELGVWPMRHVVKIDDAASGMAEGLAAGAWTIGLAASGNGVGLSETELADLDAEERALRIGQSRRVLEEAGAHYVVDTVADCLPVLVLIAARLRANAYP